MIKLTRALLNAGSLLALLATACGLSFSSEPPTDVPVAQSTKPREPGGRTATIGEIINTVEARESFEAEFSQVEDGLVLTVGGQLRTGAESGTRVDFSEGAIVRLGENSFLTIDANTNAGGDPFTSFQFGIGKLWASITGGSLEVNTPIGVATVRGSYAFFEYVPGDPNDVNDDTLTVKCLEGSCRAENDTVDEKLGNLEQITLTGGGDEFIRERLDFDDVQEFVDNNPEVGGALVATLIAAPPPTDTPATPSAILPTDTGTSFPTDTATSAPTPTLPPVTVAPSVPILGRHTLESGETLFCVGRAYGVLPNAIAQANNINLGTDVQFGQVLAIPAVQWVNIPPGPVCPPQFDSPFPGLPVSTDTPVATDTPFITATPTSTPQPVCQPPEFFDPFLNRCRLPDPTPYTYSAQLIDSPLYQALAKNQRVLPISAVSALLAVVGVAVVIGGNRRKQK